MTTPRAGNPKESPEARPRMAFMVAGTRQYQGRTMKESHAHLNITPREWDRMVTIFKEILAKHKLPATETQELLDIVESTKADNVVSGG
ncbi:globin domain-containing protein [Marinobacter sp. SS21]|uniref:globin domain-containing protein n=1 Tax=Marinobacter sp. SS21 TaxID=2979460 RepID=UPI003FA52AD5